MKFPTTCEEFLTTLKAKSKVEGRQPEKSKSESLDPFNYEEVLKVLGEKGKKCTSSLSSLPHGCHEKSEKPKLEFFLLFSDVLSDCHYTDLINSLLNAFRLKNKQNNLENFRNSLTFQNESDLFTCCYFVATCL